MHWIRGGGVILENLALGERAGECRISAKAEGGARILEDTADEGQTIKMDILDSYVAARNLEVGLIKVDIEGYEMNFLRGALNTIKTQKPVLLLSVYHNYDDFFGIKPFIENLNLGYKFDFFKGIDSSVSTDTMLLCEVY